MPRALLALLLILGHLPVAAATKRRAARHPSAPVASAALVTAARQAAEAAMAAGVPAVQIAVSHRGRTIYSEAFGVTDRESATAATPRSVLQVGSITKQFTAAAILRLAERGALTLDDRIDKFVPDFNPRGATITLRQLLSHTSGVRREWFPPGPPWPDLTAAVTRQQTIQGLNSGPLLDSPPGTKWSYSNAGFVLLGLARSDRRVDHEDHPRAPDPVRGDDGGRGGRARARDSLLRKEGAECCGGPYHYARCRRRSP